MATEYKLSYTANEINRRLGMVSTLSEEIADLQVGIDKTTIIEAVNAYLDNNPIQTGVTTAQSDSLWAILQKTAFTDALTDEELLSFKTAWGIIKEPESTTTYTITRNLTNCTSSSSTTSINENATHTESITANDGYTLTGATISITMNGSDVSSLFVNGVLNITSVTGDIVISVSAVEEIVEPDEPEVVLSSISATYTGGEVTVGTALTSLTGITVTATYSDGSTVNVAGYTLSGEIVEGSNTITVSYGGMTTTFVVTGVTESSGSEEVNSVLKLTNATIDATVGTYNDVKDAEVLSDSLIKFGIGDGTRNAIVYIRNIGLEAGKTYTLINKVEDYNNCNISYGADGSFVNFCSVRLRESSSGTPIKVNSPSLIEKFSFGTFEATSNDFLELTMQRSGVIDSTSTITYEIYIVEGEVTSI